MELWPTGLSCCRPIEEWWAICRQVLRQPGIGESSWKLLDLPPPEAPEALPQLTSASGPDKHKQTFVCFLFDPRVGDSMAIVGTHTSELQKGAQSDGIWPAEARSGEVEFDNLPAWTTRRIVSSGGGEMVSCGRRRSQARRGKARSGSTDSRRSE